MGIFLFMLAVLTIVLALILQRTKCSVRSLQNRSSAELSQLMSQLASRHMIASHLVDSIPAKFDRRFPRKRFVEIRLQAETALRAIEPLAPKTCDIGKFADRERDFVEMLEQLTDCLKADGSACASPSVAACLQGLEDATKRINDAVSTYNAAAITYSSYFETPPSSLFARIISRCEFNLFDLSPQGSHGSLEHVEA